MTSRSRRLSCDCRRSAPCLHACPRSSHMHYIRQPWHQESSTALERADADHRIREEAVPSASARGGGHLIATLRVARVAKGSCGPQAVTWVAGLASAPCHRLSHRRPFYLALSSLALDSRSFLQKHATELHLQPRAARQAGADQLAHGMAAD